MKTIQRNMRKVLLSLPNASVDESVDLSNALHECINYGYVDGIEEMRNVNGYYVFQSLHNYHLTSKGEHFLSETSLWGRCKTAVYLFIHSIWGFVLGVFTGMIIDAIAYGFTGSEIISRFHGLFR